MAAAAPDQAPELPPPFPRRLTRLALALLLLIGLVVAIPFALDSGPGRAWLARQVPRLVLENGLSFRVARIDGSLWSKASLTGIEVHDQQGRYATIDRLALDWTPLALAWNQFVAADIVVPRARLTRLPTLLPTKDPRLLPEQDIIINRLTVGRLELAPGIAGPERLVSAGGRIDIRAGRAMVQLDARALGDSGGDRLRFDLDAEPDRDRFALDARLDAPAGGIVTTLAGVSKALTASASGRGRWRAWQGEARAGLAGVTAPLADLVLTGREGRFGATGRLDPAGLLAPGIAADLLAGGLAIRAEALPEGDIVRLALDAEGRVLNGSATGQVERASERLADTQLRLSLADNAAIARQYGLNGLTATAKLAGPLLAPSIDARVTARSLTLPGSPPVTLEGLSLAGIADLNEQPASAPLALSVARVSGLPEALAPLNAAWKGEGRLRWQAGELKGDRITLTGGPVRAQLGFGWRPATGGWALDARGEARAWPLPGLGRSDAVIDARLRPGPGGVPSGGGEIRLIAAQPETAIRRVTGGNMALSGRFTLASGLAVTLSNLVLSSPDLAASGSGSWKNGGFTLAATGRSKAWGPFSLDGRGTPAAPHFEARLANPGYGVTAVALALDPAGTGWRLTGDAQSGLGPVSLAAGIALSPVLALDIERLQAGELVARGQISQTGTGPFAGNLALSGYGLDGKAMLSAAGSEQAATVDLSGRNVTLPLATPVTIDRLQVKGAGLLAAAGPRMAGTLALDGLERGSLVVERADGKLALDNGRGAATLALSGNSGDPFRLTLAANIAPDRYEISGDGDYAGRKARLASPALITRDAAGWHLARTRLASGMGNAELAGDWGSRRHVEANLDQVSLGLVTLAFPEINLSGRLSGELALEWLQDGVPVGRAALRLNGLSRSGVASTSTPIDVGLNAALGTGGSTMRAVIVRGGKVQGRVQARLSAIPAGEAPLTQRLFAAGVVGQMRYAGPAQDLWGLSGLTALDVRGPVQVAADLSGTLGDPVIAGRLKVSEGRVEAPLLGAVATDASLDARFSASRLELLRFSGTSGQGGITGSGSIDLSYERNFPMDIRVQVKDAAILGRDDLTASGSGSIRLATDEYGGVVSGSLNLTRAEYRVGRTAVADVPVLPVTEKNTRAIGRRAVQYVAPTRWLYNLAIKADNRLKVVGMGINSEWQADVRLRGAATAPELFGRVQLVRGDYDFAGKRFQLTRGDIRFLGGYPPDPIIAVTAENASSDFTALLNIDGTAQKPQIKFSSVPALPEDEVLSRVLFGSRVTDLSAPEAIQLAGALASLRGGGGGFNPIGAVSKGLGIDRLRILPADVVTGRRTTVAAGQYLGRNVYVELATDAQGYTATSIEIGLTRSLSVLSSVATLGGTSAAMRWKKDY
jgi:translocation and assembly module TamB